MNNINKKIIISIFVFFIVFLLSISIIIGNNVFNKADIKIDEEKIYYEIRYFDSRITNTINLLNNIENKPNFYINWQQIRDNVKDMYNYWNSVILDFNYLNIEKSNLTDFGKVLDELSIAIKNSNKNGCINNLIELYSKLIIYSDKIEYKEYTNILVAKYNLFCAYSVIENENWTLAYEYVLKSSQSILKIVNSMDVNQYKQYNVNQAFVSIKEMENLINIKDEEIFYIKYNIAIKKLENI